MHEIEKTLRDSDLGVNPSNDGNIIRVVLPSSPRSGARSTSSWRTHKAEEARVSIRNVRRKAKTDLDKLVKDGDVGEDDGVRRARRSSSR